MLRRLWTFLRPLVPRLFLRFGYVPLLGLIDLGFTIYGPLLNKGLLDAMQFKNTARFWHFVWVMIGIAVIKLGLSGVYRYGIARMAEALHFGLRRKLVESVLSRPLAFFRKYQVGDLISRTASDTGELKHFFSHVVMQLVFDVTTVLVVAVILFRMNVMMAIVTITSGPLSIVLGAVFQGPIQRNNHASRSRMGELMAQAQAWLARPLAIKAHMLEKIVQVAFGRKNEALRKAQLKVDLTETAASGLALVVLAAPNILVFVLGGIQVFKGNLTIGSLIAFTAYADYFHGPMQRTIEMFVVTLPGMAAVHRRLKEVVDGDEDAAGPPVAIGPVASLNVEDLRLDLGEQAGFIKIPRLAARSGEIVGIVGPNGCGKTSFLTALLALRPTTSGRIWLALEHGRIVPLHRAYCSALPQDSVILDGTLKDNITLFSDVPDQQRLDEIIRVLGMTWVHGLPEGLSTTIDAGSLGFLSGGQLQQIGLARAVYRQAPILVLDEPGTSLDVDALERAAELISAQRERLTIIITHRREILDICDRVYEFFPPAKDGASFELRAQLGGVTQTPRIAVGQDGPKAGVGAGVESER